MLQILQSTGFDFQSFSFTLIGCPIKGRKPNQILSKFIYSWSEKKRIPVFPETINTK